MHESKNVKTTEEVYANFSIFNQKSNRKFSHGDFTAASHG